MTAMPNISSELTKAALKTFDFFQAERLTFALAESCTGGLCAAAFTEIPGVSSRFLCGYIVYSNEAKQRDLGVSKETLTRFGAVSSETVSEMLKGLRQKTGCAVAGAVSGIAGPGGGTPDLFGRNMEVLVFQEQCGMSGRFLQGRIQYPSLG